MKTKYLLSALAISAAFVACDKDDQLQVNTSANINSNGVVGADLLGTGLKLYIDQETEGATRVDNHGNWEVGDKAGLGWVVNGHPSDPQADGNDDPRPLNTVESKLYGNHWYEYDGEAWASKTNIYKGWHFAYFPFTPSMEPKTLTYTDVNSPVFEILDAHKNNEYKRDLGNNALHISAAAFLNEDNVIAYEGKVTEKFAVQRVVNALLPDLYISKDFYEDEKNVLQHLNITKIELVTGANNIFRTAMELCPANLPENVYTDGKFDGDASRAAVVAKAYSLKDSKEDQMAAGAILLSSGQTNKVTTVLKEKTFYTNQERHQLRMFIAPLRNIGSSIEKYYFKVYTDKGNFLVDYDQQTNAENKASIERVHDLFNSGWEYNGNKYSFRKLSYTDKNDNDKVKLNPTVRIPLYLSKKNFTANYTIDSYEKWVECVALADALGEKPNFKLTADIEFPSTEENAPMLAPEKGVVVTAKNGAALTIVGATTWNDGIEVGEGVSVEVAEEGTLTVVNDKLQNVTLVNNGNIEAGSKAVIGTQVNSKFENKNTVTILYGAKIYPATGNTGTIAYELRTNEDGTLRDGAYQVNTLLKLSGLNEGQLGTANVNKFIVRNTAWNLDLATPGKDDDSDEYHTDNSISKTEYDKEALKNVDIEIISTDGKDAKVFSNAANEEEAVVVTFANVKMSGAGAELTGVNVSGKLEVEGQGHVDCQILNEVETDGDVTVVMIADMSQMFPAAGSFKGAALTANSVIGNIEATGNVTITESVLGNIVSAANVNAKNVYGNIIEATGDVVVTNSINGSVKAKTVTVTEGTVTGNIEATGDVAVKFIEKDVNTQGAVVATTIGSVSAAATVNATNVTGNIVATGDVTVEETIDGNVTTEGAVEATTINGSVEANSVEANKIETVGGSVKANTINVTESISANVEATGNVTVPAITGNVTLKDNALTFDCANVAGDVTVEGATVTSVATNVSGTLTVVGTYNMQSAPKTSPATLTIGNIVVGNEDATKSTLNVNSYNTVETVDVMVYKNATLDASKTGSIVLYSGNFDGPGTSKNVKDKNKLQK